MTQLKISALQTISNEDGTFTLLTPLKLSYASPDRKGRLFVIVPRGFVTDLYSIPWCLRIFMSKSGPGASASVIHDWLCVNKFFSSGFAADVFYEVMVHLGVNAKKAALAAFAVRYFGPKF